MPRLNVTDLTAQIDKLIGDFEALRPRARFDDLSDLKEESATLVVRLRAAIERLAPGNNTYAKELYAIANDPKNNTSHKIRVYIGILRALRADANDGFFEGIAELLHADTLGDFLDQATELVDKGYKDAAAVMSGSALEAHIRLLCQKYGVDTQLALGQPKKAGVMNADLVKASAYNTVQQQSITGWLAIRNAAAHGKYSEYSRDQVSAMIGSVRDFIKNYPA